MTKQRTGKVRPGRRLDPRELEDLADPVPSEIIDIPPPADASTIAKALEEVRRAAPGLRRAGIQRLRLHVADGDVEIELRPEDLVPAAPARTEDRSGGLDDPLLYPGGIVPRLPAFEEDDDGQSR